MTSDRYRLIYIGLGLALTVVVLVTVAVVPRGDEDPLPGPIDDVFPRPNTSVIRQSGIEVDMRVGYRVEVFVDGRRIPETDVRFVEPTGQYLWTPGPDQVITEWTPGEHTVRITWDTLAGRPDPGEFEWTFRSQ
ncbi:MAG: hypothetical protein ACE5KX_05005 [Acidimicrobiia bacterium]